MSWPKATLGEVVDDSRNGFACGAKDDHGVLQVRMNNVTSEGAWDWSAKRRVPIAKVPKGVALEPGDILFNMTNSPQLVGKSALFLGSPEEITFSNHFLRLRTKPEKADPRYVIRQLHIAFQRRVFENACRQWVNQATVPADRVMETQFPLPPLEEQRRIAGILDATDALRRCRREALALLDTLPGAIFAEMFGDRLHGPDRATDTVPLAEVAHIQSGITKGRRLKSGEETEETAYLAVANVQDKRLDLSNVKMIDTTEKERERYALAVGDLLLTEGGDPDKLGRGTVWNDEIPGAIHQNHIFRVRVTDETVQPIFLSHLLSSPYGRGYFLRMAKQTTGIASINKTQLSGFPAILPDEGEQIEFVQRLKSYQDQEERYISHLGEVDGLFASLQSRAFAGEL